ncbi:CIC11C00000000204 [Sungouiella intermedia]|uniref:Kinetochore protein NDC80 n=1 Tax=Sungouiella intermedia TaxID=45354 RepID=A0A1L0DK13_9ASCO|nr:CIC11C00000000204 [[Candida] intermedia]
MEHHTPSAAQLLRKTQRLSIAGATRASIGMRTSNSFESAKRRSTLLMTPASNKRQSVYAVNGNSEAPGSSQTVNSQSQLSQNLFPLSERRDQRPLRDRNYQTLILEEIYDFLVTNKFELEMNHPITKKTLRQPTQKDFVLIFQFLYGRIDPHYKFTRAIETEVFLLLKILNYPYLDGINRSSISAVGGQNWSAFLGMLYWLVKLNLSLLNLNEDSLIAPDDVFDRVFIKYIISSYRAFIDQKEDYTEFYEEMKQAFDTANNDVILALEEKQKAGETLRKEFDQLNKQYSELEEAEAKSKALENDLKQFSNYMMQMEARQAKWGELLQQMQTGIEQAEQQLVDLETEKKTYENIISTKGYSISDIDKLNMERDKLSKAIDSIYNRIKDAEDGMTKKEQDLRQSLQSLESFVNQYNLMTQRIPVSENQLFELSINTSIMEENAKLDPEHILNKTLREEKIRLLESRSELTQEIHRIQEDNFKVGEQVDQYSEKIFDQQEYIEGLEAEVTKNKLTHDEILDTMLSEGTSYTAQIEKMQRELQGMQINVNKGVIDAETRHKELNIMFQELKYHIKEQREVMHDTVQKLINYVILFKLNVQENIEELDILTLRELNVEEQGQ